MIIFHLSTRGYLSMKEARGKYGGNFMGTMVSIGCLICFFFFVFISNLCFVIGWSQLVPSCTYTPLSFYSTVGETVEIGNFDPKIATFWIDSGNIYNFCVHICVGVYNFSWCSNFILAAFQANWKVFSLKAEVLRYFLILFYFFGQTRNRAGSRTNEPRSRPWREVEFLDISKDRGVMMMGWWETDAWISFSVRACDKNLVKQWQNTQKEKG